MRMQMLAALAVLTGLTATLCAGWPSPDPMMPYSRKSPGVVPVDVPGLRANGVAWTWAPTRDAALQLGVEYGALGEPGVNLPPWHYAAKWTKLSMDPSPCVVSIPEIPNARAEAGHVELGFSRYNEVSATAQRSGLFQVTYTGGLNAVHLRPTRQTPWLTYEASSDHRLYACNSGGDLYFYVPRRAKTFTIHMGPTGGHAELITLSLIDPDGKTRLRRVVHQERPVTVDVADGQDGRLWHLHGRLPRPEDLKHDPEVSEKVAQKVRSGRIIIEDYWVSFSGDVLPYVSPWKHGLLVPMLDGIPGATRVRTGDGIRLPVRLHAQPRPGETLALRLLKEDTQISALKSAADETAELSFPATLAPGAYKLQAVVTGKDGPVVEGMYPVHVTPRFVFLGKPTPLLEASVHPENLQDLVLDPRFEGARSWSVSVELLHNPFGETPGHPRSDIVFRKRVAGFSGGVTVEAPSDLADGHYRWRVRLLDDSGAVVERVTANFGIYTDREGGHHVSREFLDDAARWQDRVPLALARRPAADEALVPFTHGLQEGFAYFARPTSKTAGKPVVIRAAPGEFEPGTFAVWAPEGAQNCRVSLSDLRGPEGELPTSTVNIRVARHWPQRFSGTKAEYYICPELLEANHPFDLAADHVRQIWLTFRASADAAAGTYTGNVRVSADGARPVSQSIRIEVLPFELRKPDWKRWALYSDTGRWQDYSAAKIRSELRDWKEHGFDQIMLYPRRFITLSRSEDGDVRVDTGRFEQHMDRVLEAGFTGPWVLSVQGLHRQLGRLLRKDKVSAEVLQAYKRILEQLVTLARERGVEDVALHAIDELARGWSRHRKTAPKIFPVVDSIDARTWRTAIRRFPLDKKYIDEYCFNHGKVLNSPCQTRYIGLAEMIGFKNLSFYGYGCQSRREGAVKRNRFIAGVSFYFGSPTTAWCWTFQRVDGTMENDWDGGSGRPDFCTAYPSRGDGPAIPTLQYEGIREGVDDARYLHTLRTLAEDAAGPEREQAMSAYHSVRDDIMRYWSSADAKNSLIGPNGAMETWRNRIIDAILKLRE